MNREIICIACPRGCKLTVTSDLKVSGNLCKRGEVYGVKEVKSPTRIVTSTVVIKGGINSRLPVRTEDAIPKELIFQCMKEINNIRVKAPIKMNDIIIENFQHTGINIIASRDMDILNNDEKK